MGEEMSGGMETSGLKRRLYVKTKNRRITGGEAREILLGSPYAGLEEIIQKEMHRFRRSRPSRGVRVFR
jgi:hypothetical protein